MNKYKVRSMVIYLMPVGILTMVLVILKLLSVITWQWLWVLSPLWIYYSGAALLFICIYAYVVYDEKRQHKEWLIHLEEMKRVYGDDEGIETQKKIDNATLAK